MCQLRDGPRRSQRRCRGGGGAAAISSRSDAAGAGGGQARAGREAGVSDDGGLPHGEGRADAGGRVVLVGENDHYKPLAVRAARDCSPTASIGEMVFAHFTTIARRLKAADDWRNDEAMAGGDAFFEEGIHWLHLAGSLGPRIVASTGYRPARVLAAGRTGAPRA